MSTDHDIDQFDGAGTPVREHDGGTGRTIPTSTVPDARTGEPTQEEDTRWWFVGLAGVGLVILVAALLLTLT